MSYNLFIVFFEEKETITFELKVFSDETEVTNYVKEKYPDVLENSIIIEKIDKVDDFEVFVKYAGIMN